MSKVQQINLTNLTQLSDIVRFLNPFCSQVSQALNNGLSFQDNMRVSIVTVLFPATANQNIAVKHGLPVIPIGYIPVQYSAAASIYNGNSLVLGSMFANLKSSVGGITASIMFF